MAMVRTLESHTSDPHEALMVLVVVIHSLMTAQDIEYFESFLTRHTCTEPPGSMPDSHCADTGKTSTRGACVNKW
ncbi:hypothetical protein CS238_22040 [Salmonella enterica]|nr:hypothetical protein [Salmonella enterica]EJC8750096.1 hypothetical protein [Salmonella enterica]HCM1652016.1 hypothetical protein [Salmonella enterica subsp. diarizonae serovar 48:i:z35]